MTSANRYKSHLLVIPEDDANRQVANGFLELGVGVNQKSYQIMPLAGGWPNAFDSIKDSYAMRMRKFQECRILLVIDFDHDANRLEENMHRIPEDLRDRVFVIGISSKDPKDLCQTTGMTLEEIGQALAKSCADDTLGLWGDDLLKHNKAELDRMGLSVKPFLFG